MPPEFCKPVQNYQINSNSASPPAPGPPAAAGKGRRGAPRCPAGASRSPDRGPHPGGCRAGLAPLRPGGRAEP